MGWGWRVQVQVREGREDCGWDTLAGPVKSFKGLTAFTIFQGDSTFQQQQAPRRVWGMGEAYLGLVELA